MRESRLSPASIARVKARLRAIPQKFQEAAAAALEAAAEDLVKDMKAAVPVDQGDLRDSVRQYDAEDEAGVGRRVVAGSRKAFYAAFIEHGTKRTGAKPFFFPTYRRNKTKIRRRVARAIKEAAQEA